MDPQHLTEAFGIWAAVVGMIGVAIVWELSRLRTEVRVMANSLTAHIIATEHRMTAVESHLYHRDGFKPVRYRGDTE